MIVIQMSPPFPPSVSGPDQLLGLTTSRQAQAGIFALGRDGAIVPGALYPITYGVVQDFYARAPQVGMSSGMLVFFNGAAGGTLNQFNAPVFYSSLFVADEDNYVYRWDTRTGVVTKTCPLLPGTSTVFQARPSLGSIAPLTAGAGVKTAVAIPLRDTGGTGGLAKLLANGRELWQGNLQPGESRAMNFPLTVPFDNAIVNFATQTWDCLNSAWQDFDRQDLQVFPQFPVLALRLGSGPFQAPAGTKQQPNIAVQETSGAGGQARVLSGSTVLWAGTVTPNQQLALPYSFTMPWDDAALPLTVEVLGRGQVWRQTDAGSLQLAPTFPNIVVQQVSGPERAVPGDSMAFQAVAVNRGADGWASLQLGVGESAIATNQVFVPAGGAIMGEWSGAMPGVRAADIAATPFWVGRGQRGAQGSTQSRSVTAKQVIFVEDTGILYVNGDKPTLVGGVIVGQGVAITGAEAPISPLGGPFVMRLAPYGAAELTFSQNAATQWKAENPFAIVSKGRVAARGASSYSLGALALPFNLLGGIFSFVTTSGARARATVMARA